MNKKQNPALLLRLDEKTLRDFKELCERESREYNAQFKIIFYQWLEQKEKKS